MTSTLKPVPRLIGGWLLVALICLAVWVLCTAAAAREPLELMLQWELLAVFARHETHGWYRIVIALTGLDALIGVFTVAGAGWLALLAWRKAARFPAQLQTWLFAILVMRTGAYLFGAYLTDTIGVEIALPVDGFVQAAIAAALGIPYFRLSRRVRETFVNA
ncbi:DUF2569 domain-containing protein [Paraburkholderia ginsengisoli]|uniref:DUF2569 domain-containing protein n=1 Tax=Paraburkholderia ginsengisoli TaxID=311231 RepID=A0A7T4N2Q6_9BURK|nr:DUF2569 domain-containing protein [Paraburkholderia ginsengisoli]QQC64166.1 DUF2569 domain-containing protein [Paraburkholderia ginsengisoli]